MPEVAQVAAAAAHRQRPSAPPLRPAPPVADATLDGSWDEGCARATSSPTDHRSARPQPADAHAALGDIIESDVGERVLLVITGKGRADRPSRIRSELNYWLEASRLRSRIAAMRQAHPRHGGSGAFYVILRRSPSAFIRTLAPESR